MGKTPEHPGPAPAPRQAAKEGGGTEFFAPETGGYKRTQDGGPGAGMPPSPQPQAPAPQAPPPPAAPPAAPLAVSEFSCDDCSFYCKEGIFSFVVLDDRATHA